MSDAKYIARVPGTKKSLYLAPPLLASKIIVPASSTVIIDTYDKTLIVGIKYTFCVYNKLQGVQNIFEASILNQVTDSVSNLNAKLGGAILFELNDSINGANLEIEIVNNQSYDLTIEFTKQVFGT